MIFDDLSKLRQVVGYVLCIELILDEELFSYVSLDGYPPVSTGPVMPLLNPKSCWYRGLLSTTVSSTSVMGKNSFLAHLVCR